MKTRSAKQKGRRLQQNVRDLLLEALSEYLEEDDIRSTSMGAPGEDLLLSPLARKLVPLSLECKNQEALPLWKSLAQAEDNSNGRDPVLIIKRNRSGVYAVIQFDVFTKLIERNIDGKSLKTKEDNT